MYIGIDLGGTNIGIGIVDENNKLLSKDSIPTKRDRSYEEILEDIKKLILHIIKITKLDKSKIKGIGIGVPGVVEPKTGVIIDLVNLGWKNVNIKADIESEVGIPTYVGNDATVAGIAEFEIGSMKNHNSGVLLTLGTGIGAGIVLNGKIYEGVHGIGSEIGHMIVGENYYDCNCGRNGCLETFCSSTAIINYTLKLIDEGRDTKVLQKVKGDKDKINGKIIFKSAMEGDQVALEVIDRMVKYLSRGIVNIISVIDPEVFILGGGLSAAGDFLLNKVKLEVENNRYYSSVEIGEVLLSTIGNDGGIIGAAYLSKHKSN